MGFTSENPRGTDKGRGSNPQRSTRMIYARFSRNNSSVYVYEDVGGDFTCCWCLLGRNCEKFNFTAKTRGEMILHLLFHRIEGETVPQYALDRLAEEEALG